MADDEKAKPQQQKPDWADRVSKLAVPVIGGLLVALAAFLGDQILTDFTSRQENARLITQLQIQREQAESDLRKDIFQQAIGALLSEEELKTKSGLSLSKRMLKLELLAQNFGGSLSLTPLFMEFERDLEQLEQLEYDEGDLDDEARMRNLRKRLRSVARRLSSDQLSALAQHGALVEIDVGLKPRGKEFAATEVDAAAEGQESTTYSSEYKWPDDLARSNLTDPLLYGDQYASELEKEKRALGVVELDGIERFVTVTLGDLDPERQTVKVDLEICWNADAPKQEYACQEGEDQRVGRAFTLNFFNFPKIDNTRLSDNQRFSMVLEEFEPGSARDPGRLEIAAVIFPAEHSSLRELPSMQEAVNLLNSVLRSQQAGEQEEISDANRAF